MEQQTLFRKKTLERISSPEQLTDYLKVTNAGIWIVLGAVIALLIGVFAWSAVGTLETTQDVKVVVNDHVAKAVVSNAVDMSKGMTIKVSGQEVAIANVEDDEYGRKIGIAEISLPDGMYDGEVVTDKVHAIDFLLTNK